MAGHLAKMGCEQGGVSFEDQNNPLFVLLESGFRLVRARVGVNRREAGTRKPPPPFSSLPWPRPL